MTKIQTLVVSAALAIGMAAPASAAQSDPEVIIYRFPGVKDNTSLDIATVFFCTNFSGAFENIRFVTRAFNVNLVTNVLVGIQHLGTTTVSTHGTAQYPASSSMNTGSFDGGTTAIAATSINVICTAAIVDGAAKAVGFTLRGIRFNPAPGSQE